MHRQDSGIRLYFEVEAGVERGSLAGTQQVDSQLRFSTQKSLDKLR